jgi:4-hydroxybenzoate polyprenyltransferase
MKALIARLDAYEKLVRLDKPIGILLLAWPTLWALWLAARGVPNLLALWLFMLGTVLMRSAGCAINDFADRNFDAHVERTRARPLAAGVIRPGEALAVAAALSLAALGIVLQFNTLTVALSVPAVLIAVIYPFTKRFFWLPQAWLGLAFGFGIPMAFAAILGRVPPVAWYLLAANVFWTMAYDTEYAMVDRDDDVKLGIRTSAILFGRFDVAAIMACYAAFLGILVAIGAYLGRGPFFYAGIAVAAAIAAYHYRLIRGRTRAGCFKAFLHNNWIGAAIFAGIVADHVPQLRALRLALAVAAAGIVLGGCGTTHATIETSRGENLMLLGYDPVAYFTDGKPARGRHTINAAHEGRTYYFASPEHRAAFVAAPARYEPQYGGFCSNGAPYAVKLGADPTQFEIRDGRLFIFGDILGHEMWLLDWKANIEHADRLWPGIRDKGWRGQSLRAWTFKVPWYRTGASLMQEWKAKHPGRTLEYDTGGLLNNLVFKYPGWRAREGYGQPALGVPGEADDR